MWTIFVPLVKLRRYQQTDRRQSGGPRGRENNSVLTLTCFSFPFYGKQWRQRHMFIVWVGGEALKTESSECFLLFGPWGWDVDILGTSENQRLKCSVRGRAVVDGCLGQL